MPNENASAAISARITESIASPVDLDLIVEELAAVAGQAERERDLLLARKLAELGQREAEHELRLHKLEQEIRNRLATLRDGEKGGPGEKGEKGEQGDKGETIQGEKGDQGARGETGEKGEQGETGAPGADGNPGDRGVDGSNGKDGVDGQRGLDGRSFTIRDTYDPTESYLELDVVTLNATWFIARKDAPGPCPGPDWKAGPSGRRGERGERGERGQPGQAGAPGRELAGWKLDRKEYTLTPVMSDGNLGPAIPLRALFEQYQAEVG
jgi:integrin beta 3